MYLSAFLRYCKEKQHFKKILGSYISVYKWQLSLSFSLEPLIQI